MKDKPLIISLLIGLLVVLVIAGVSLLAQIRRLSETYKQKVAENIELEKVVEELKVKNLALEDESSKEKEEVGELKSRVDKLKIGITKLKRLKEKLEENLKEELMKREPVGETEAKETEAKETEKEEPAE